MGCYCTSFGIRFFLRYRPKRWCYTLVCVGIFFLINLCFRLFPSYISLFPQNKQFVSYPKGDSEERKTTAGFSGCEEAAARFLLWLSITLGLTYVCLHLVCTTCPGDTAMGLLRKSLALRMPVHPFSVSVVVVCPSATDWWQNTHSSISRRKHLKDKWMIWIQVTLTDGLENNCRFNLWPSHLKLKQFELCKKNGSCIYCTKQNVFWSVYMYHQTWHIK